MMSHPERHPLSLLRSARFGWLLMGVFILAHASPSDAEEDAGGAILHEHFDARSARLPGAASGASARGDAPRVIHEGVELPAPTTDQSPRPGEPVLDQEGAHLDPNQPPLSQDNGPAAGSSRHFALDDDTDMEGVLQYYTVFNPSVVPFKRGGVFDTITVTRDGQYVLGVGDTRLRALPIVGDDLQPDRDRFWGSLAVNAIPDHPIPIPSVAPGARILTVETSPPMEAEFFVDGADNMFVKLDGKGPVRLNFLTDARSDYFSAPLSPEGITTREAAAYSRGPRLPRGQARNTARRIARTIGLDKDEPFRVTLDGLVGYYREFDATPLSEEEGTGDRLLDIATAKRGVCRHRAFAFVATASYLGLHARYVYNEAHAFIEVFVPLRGWVRVDLGGGAEGLQVHNGDSKIRHAPDQHDPFPQPDAFEDAYSRAGTANADEIAGGFEEVEGLPPHPSEITDEGTGDDGLEEWSTEGGTEGELALDVAGEGGTPSHAGPTSAPPNALAHVEEGVEPEDGAPSVAAAQQGTLPVARLSTSIQVTSSSMRVLRGETLTLGGRLYTDSDNEGLVSHELVIYLEPVGDTPGERTTLITTTTGARGEFQVDVEVPPTLPQGRWDLYAYYPGDLRTAPTRSQ